MTCWFNEQNQERKLTEIISYQKHCYSDYSTVSRVSMGTGFSSKVKWGSLEIVLTVPLNPSN